MLGEPNRRQAAAVRFVRPASASFGPASVNPYRKYTGNLIFSIFPSGWVVRRYERPEERDALLDEMRLLHVGTGATRFGTVSACTGES